MPCEFDEVLGDFGLMPFVPHLIALGSRLMALGFCLMALGFCLMDSDTRLMLCEFEQMPR